MTGPDRLTAAEIATVRAQAGLVDTISRRGVKLTRQGREYVGLCPFHEEKSPSFTVNEDKGFYYCFGCAAHGDVIAFVMDIAGCSFREAVEDLRGGHGPMSPEDVRRAPAQHPAETKRRRDDADQQQRMEFARQKWREAVALMDSPVEMYLRERGLKPGPEGWPPSLRYHPALKHGFSGLLLPALVGAVTIWPSRNVVGLHRTFLRADGKAKAPVTKPKMMIGRCGGGAVRLAPAGPELVLSEGIETGLTVQQAAGKPVWATLSTSGLRSVILPPEVETVIIAADGDEAGEEAAQKAARRFIAEGRTVKIARPPIGFDFNDLIQLPNDVAVITDHRRRMRAND